MALVLHLPFNGDILDYTNNNIFENINNTQFSDDGKVGKSINFNGVDNSIICTTFDNNIFTNTKNHTISFWCKAIQKDGDNGIFSTRTSGATGNLLHIVIRSNRMSYRFHSPDVAYDTDIVYNQWTHYTMMLKDRIMYLYTNGVFVKKYQMLDSHFLNVSGNGINIGRYSNGYGNVKLNDFRIYDEALSDKEIYDIYKTKVLHYSFNSSSEPTENIIKNYGYSLTGMHGIKLKYLGSEDGWDKFGISGTFTGGTYPYSINITGPRNCHRDRPQSMSFDMKSNVWHKFKDNFMPILVNIVWKGACRRTMTQDGNIKHIKLEDFSPNTRTDGTEIITHSDTIYMYSIPNDGAIFNENTDFIYVKNYHMEENTYCTEYTEYSRDGIVYDTSSFKNNSIMIKDKMPMWKNDSNVINGYYKFSNNNKNIIIEQNVIESMFRNNEFTISLWYMTSNLVATTEVFSSRRNGLCCGFRIHNDGGNIRLNLVKYTIVDQYVTTNVKYENNRWYNIVVVQNSTCVKYYIDGNLVGTYNSNLLFTNINNSLELNGVGVYSINDVNISDFRIYANELSQSDISNIYNEKLNIDNKSNVLVNSISEHSNLVKDVSDSDFWNYKPTSGSIVWGVENKYIPNENALLINSHSSSHHGHSFKLPIICDKKYRFKCRVKTSGNQVYGYLYILLFNNDIVVKTNHRPTISNNTYTGYNGSEYKNTSIDFIIDGSNITDIQCTHFAIQLIGAGNSSSNIYIKDIELYLVDDFDMDDVVNRKSLIKKHINEFGVSNNLIFNANMKMNNINYSKTINTHTLVDSTNNSNLVSYNGKSAYYPTGTYSDISNPLIIDGEFTILYNVIFKKDKPASHVYTHFSIAENVINCNRNTDGILSFWMGGNPDHYHDQVVMNKQYTCAIVCRKNGDKFDYITIANDKRVETLENVKKITRLNVTINNDKDGETPSDFDEIEFSDLMIYDRGLSDEELYLQYDIVSGNKLHIRPNEIIAKKFSEGL